MATENVKVLRIDTNPAQTSVKDLRNELKELRSTMLSCEEGTEEYNNALRQAAKIQHTLKEQMEQVNATAMDFGQIASNCTNAVGGMVAGFQAAKAAMNLLGVENEEVLKAMQKMQSLMALTQAFPAIDKGIKAFKALGIAIRGAAAATSTLGKALIATGIGAAIAAVGLLIANWDKLSDAMNKSAKAAELASKAMKDSVKTAVDAMKGMITDLGKMSETMLKSLREVAWQNLKQAVKADEIGISANDIIDMHNRYTKALKDGNAELAFETKKSMDTILNGHAELKDAYENFIRISQELHDRESDGLKKTVKTTEKAVDDIKKAYQNLEKEINNWYKTDIQIQIQNLRDAENQKLQIVSEMEKKQEITHEQAEEKRYQISKYYARKIRDIEFGDAVSKIKEPLNAMNAEIETLSKEITYFSRQYVANRNLLEWAFETGEIQWKDYVKSLSNYNKSDITDMIYYVEAQAEKIQQTLDDTVSAIEVKYHEAVDAAHAELEKLQLEQDELLKQGLITYEEYLERITEIHNEYEERVKEAEQELINTTNEAIVRNKQEVGELYSLSSELHERLRETSELLYDAITNALDEAANALNELSDNPAWGKMLSQIADLTDKWDEYLVAIKRGGEDAASAYLAVAGTAFAAVGSMMTGLANEQDTANREGFESAKKYQIAAAVMNTLAGIVSGLASSMQLPFPANLIIGAILTTMMAAVGGAQIAKIQQQEFEGGGSSGAGAGLGGVNTGAVNSLIAPVQYTQDVQGASIEDTIKNQKVYVTETDISNTQKKVSVSESESRY